MSVKIRSGAAHRRETGFSLIEVLVAMLVLAIGLLGLAALQTQGVRFNHDAMVRTQATTLAYDIVDKMRANRDQADSYVTAEFPDRNAEPAGGYTADDPPYDCEGAAQKTASVETDLACWLNAVELSLPFGRATVEPGADANLYDITLLWLDREPRDFGGTTRLPQTEAECEAFTNRQWDAGNSRCMVMQTWTVWP